MRSLRTIVAVLFGLTVFASFTAAGGGLQQKTTVKSGMMKPTKAAIYACPKCEVASYAPGNCKGCGAKMEKINAAAFFTCSKCHTLSTSGGKCPKCGTMTKRVARTYACDHCHVTALAAGKCPKCGMAMKQHVLPMKV